jgi:ribosome-associated protein
MPREIRVPEAELRFAFARSSGPGGQNVNKVETKVELRWDVRATGALDAGQRARLLARAGRRVTSEGELVLTSQRYRDRARNSADCRAKLEALLAAIAEPPRARRRTRPSRASIERRLRAKRARSETKRRRREED